MKKYLSILFCMMFAVILFSCVSGKNNEQTAPEEAVFRDIRKTTATSDIEEAVDMFIQGTGFLDNGQYEDAEICFREAITLDPDYIDAMDYLGIALRRLGKTDEAIKVLKQSIERDPINPVPYNSLTIAYVDKDDLNKALETCDEQIRTLPRNADGYYQKGIVLMKQNKHSDALQYLEKALEIYENKDESQYNETICNIGICYYNMKEWKNAEKFLEMAKKAFPEDETVDGYYESTLFKTR